MLPGFPGGIPLVGLWRRVHEFSGNVTTAYHRVWADAADLFSDTVIFPATWHGCIFWTCEQVQAIKLDRQSIYFYYARNTIDAAAAVVVFWTVLSVGDEYR